MVHLPVNHNERNDAVTPENYDINRKNFWLEKDVSISKDITVWKEKMSDVEKETFVKALTGLTLLDTKQGSQGMPLIALHESDDQVVANLSFMGAMEHIHAKSYSKIFMNLLSPERINYYMKEWVAEQVNLQYKVEKVVAVYRTLFKPEATLVERWKAKAVSVALETGLFYSGFYFPLLLGGGWGGENGVARMTDSNDIINLIIRDESVHGQYTGWSAWTNFIQLDEDTQAELVEWFNNFMLDLYENELEYTKELYTPLGLVEDVNKFVRFNFNQVFENLNLEPIFEEEKVNPIVLAGLSTETKTHDYFSRNSNSYFKANVTPITDNTFNLNRP